MQLHLWTTPIRLSSLHSWSLTGLTRSIHPSSPKSPLDLDYHASILRASRIWKWMGKKEMLTSTDSWQSRWTWDLAHPNLWYEFHQVWWVRQYTWTYTSRLGYCSSLLIFWGTCQCLRTRRLKDQSYRSLTHCLWRLRTELSKCHSSRDLPLAWQWDLTKNSIEILSQMPRAPM